MAVGERSVVTAGSKDTRVENAWSMRAVSGTCMPALMLSDTLKKIKSMLLDNVLIMIFS